MSLSTTNKNWCPVGGRCSGFPGVTMQPTPQTRDPRADLGGPRSGLCWRGVERKTNRRTTHFGGGSPMLTSTGKRQSHAYVTPLSLWPCVPPCSRFQGVTPRSRLGKNPHVPWLFLTPPKSSTFRGSNRKSPASQKAKVQRSNQIAIEVVTSKSGLFFAAQ